MKMKVKLPGWGFGLQLLLFYRFLSTLGLSMNDSSPEFMKAYEPQGVEDAIYQKWLDSGYFTPENLPDFAERKEVFSIAMPPPNVTGVLHLGHSLENSLMDAMARYQRLLGKKVLLVPGTDHAALPTQARVEKMLMKDGLKNPRQELGREGLVAKIREYAEQSRSTILSQIKKMGTSCDWSRLAYTFDEPRNVAVNELFKRMYNDGLIYRGYRVVNWSVKGQSTFSDDEIMHVERAAKLYTFKYGKDFPIAIATTRPETKLGDTAVAVHPDDERYQKFIGQTFTVDVGAAEPLKIKIIADQNVDPKFGTGALGVTPAHSAIDFAMYELQKMQGNPIEIIPVIGKDGKMTAAAGQEYVGLNVEEAREKFVAWLRAQDLLISEEDITQNVATNDRYGDVIEAIPMEQWWLDVNKTIPQMGKSLRDLLREAVTSGLNGEAAQKVDISPERSIKIYLDRVESLRDWCISRQIWWGHRIPVWYKDGEMVVSEVPMGEGWVQDEDTLDTWFSSATWTFSTLGWPKQTADLATYHPTSWMQMGSDNIYLWMMRMILMSAYALQQIPFKEVYFHGILRDDQGRKFSKSLGNSVDPLEVIAQYGCDALRVSLLVGNTPGNDSRFSEERVGSARNLVNKIWNISRYISMNVGELRHVELVFPKTLTDKWILGCLAQTVEKVSKLFDQSDFSLATEILREFTWTDFADWYLEIAKVEKGKDDILNYILERLLILWHPFMPFVTEEIYARFNNGMLLVAKWPDIEDLKEVTSSVDHLTFTNLQATISAIRNIRAEYQVTPKQLVDVVLSDKEILAYSDIIIALAKVRYLTVGVKPEQAASAVVGFAEVHVSLEGLVDTEKERTKIEAELVSTKKYIEVQTMKLDNADFVSRAPEKVILGEKAKLAEAIDKVTKLEQQLSSMK